MMKLSDAIKDFADICEIVRDGSFEILELCSRIRAPQALTFLEKERFAACLDNKGISCVLCTENTLPLIPDHVEGVVVCENPKALFFQLHNKFSAEPSQIPSQISPSAVISPLAYVAPYGVIIGDNVVLEPYVCVGERTVIKEDVHVCYGTVIGGKSFDPFRSGETAFLAADAGSVCIEKGVEICSLCHIACGTLKMDETRIGAYSKLDAMVHIGHGTVIGERTFIPSMASIAGNCVIGSDIWIGPNATVSNRVEIGNGGRVSLGSVVTKNVSVGETVTGNFAIPHQKFLANLKKSLE